MPEIVSSIVEVCVFQFRDDIPEYLLLRRSPTERLYPNLWQLVTGKIKEGESALQAAVRELQEETSLALLRFWTVPHVSIFYESSTDVLQHCPLFAAQVSPFASPRISGEHSSFQWMTYQVAVQALVWPGQRDGVTMVHQMIAGGQIAGDLLRIHLPP